jgi:hypothetical protein
MLDFSVKKPVATGGRLFEEAGKGSDESGSRQCRCK